MASLAQHASHLAQQGRDDIGVISAQQYSDMTKIALYTTIILVDDSGSMNLGDRIPAVEDALVRITTIATTFEKEGIMLRFLNYPENAYSPLPKLDLTVPVMSLQQVEEIFCSVEFSGGTDIGGALTNKIVRPMLLAPARAYKLERPILCSIITDGEPDSRQAVKRAILEAVQGLEEAGYKETGR